MSTRDVCSYFLDLGDLGPDYEAEVVFNWYKCKRETEDDYDDLEVEHIYVMVNGNKIDVISSITKNSLEYIVDACWDSLENEA